MNSQRVLLILGRLQLILLGFQGFSEVLLIFTKSLLFRHKYVRYGNMLLSIDYNLSQSASRSAAQSNCIFSKFVCVSLRRGHVAGYIYKQIIKFPASRCVALRRAASRLRRGCVAGYISKQYIYFLRRAASRRVAAASRATFKNNTYISTRRAASRCVAAASRATFENNT